MQIRTAALCTMLLVAVVTCLGQNPQPWVQIFDGKTLTGWKRVGQEKWVVEDGAIYGEGITGAYGYLATEKTYKAFHLSLRYGGRQSHPHSLERGADDQFHVSIPGHHGWCHRAAIALGPGG